MIVLWGPPADAPLGAVLTALLRRGVPLAVIDTASATRYEVELEVDPGVTGTLALGARRIALEDVRGAYLRPQVPVGSAAAAVHEALWAFSEVTPATVLNRPAAMAGNGCKPHQARQARTVGFLTPATLITTSAETVLGFAEHFGSVIYKSTSGVRSIVAEFDPADLPRLDDLTTCPTQFQERIDGIDVRVHVVGDRLHACEVRSGAIDYRYAAREGSTTELRSTELPAEIRDRCLRLAELAGLPLAGIDLRRTPAGDWYCFEVNPSPGFTFYADATGQPIADAIADLLTR